MKVFLDTNKLHKVWTMVKDLEPHTRLVLYQRMQSQTQEDAAKEAKHKDPAYTKAMLDRFCGAWEGDETAEEIIANINDSK